LVALVTGPPSRAGAEEAGRGHGKNYWPFEPGGWIRWLSSRIGLEVSAFTSLDVNTEDDVADYHTGSQFHLDLTVAQRLPLWGGYIGAGASAPTTSG
jgi:hypothetical protein